MFKLFYFFIFCVSALNAHSLTKSDIPIHPYVQNRDAPQNSTLALCSLFRNEAPFLREWIEYHRLLGVTHFYLYNNLSTDDFLDVLKPYLQKGIVELFDVPFETAHIRDKSQSFLFVQKCCYNHAIKLAKANCKWLAIIDSDEFICPVKERDIPSVLQQFQYASGLAIYWQTYGTSQVWDLQPQELMLDRLVYKFPSNYSENWHYKMIVKPKYAKNITPHACEFSKGHAYTPDGKRFKLNQKMSTVGPPIDLIRINHYRYRTESFYLNHKKKRHSEWGMQVNDEKEDALFKKGNSVHDPIIKRFTRQLRNRMFKE